MFYSFKPQIHLRVMNSKESAQIDNPSKCNYENCDRGYTNQECLQKHIAYRHSNVKTCSKCSKGYSTNEEFRDHMKFHAFQLLEMSVKMGRR
ncbi:unnamed protein product [Ambrosiozyma monospora]|uniref:Unnamed protein product n=1 Tax=Ambrosiozyma monospora TaxID=43982 RepID=A0ACB5SVF8_AMBMO|nr:unnamed protein product [Ambrosiozyma monospora]